MDGFAAHHVQFFTAVCKDWLALLATDKAKGIIINDLQFRIKKGQAKVCAYVIMPTHLHLIWRIGKEYKREDVQRDFLKFTARALLKLLKEEDTALYSSLLVDAKDRKYQGWKRDSMSIDLYSDRFFQQKLEYIHANPCQPKWSLVPTPFDYKYSSAAFYEMGKDKFDLVTHYSDI